MQKMITFKLSRECREIAVNPAKVLYVCHYDNGASSLHFSKDCFVRVQGDLAEVTRILEAAMCGAEMTAPAGAEDRGSAKVN